MSERQYAVYDERKRRLILAAQQASRIDSIDSELAATTEDDVRDAASSALAHEEYVHMVVLGAKMLEQHPARVVLMLMKMYKGLPRSHIARLYGCSVETVRKALVLARETAKQMREGG